MNTQRIKLLFTLTYLTIVFGLLPFIIYFVERSMGWIPDVATWYAAGVNHGPWRSAPEGLTIIYPLVLLIATTLVMSAYKSWKSKELRPLLIGIALVIVQTLALFAQMYFLTWTID